ncbi:hypothetical protein DMB66_56335 [Actinoplanes sp. ATCC 53533]|uniref:hypothetical protein n=1 Tax=Actinoplanes sp. ATCC 53533 TaxID=1288362 RepID=UPI000F7AC3EC|nr:hypothetical protein [Actinoplanes sp. ATCC 53533]RSM41272.1 hypothetical protein DMB66_56335 [Actinoplanes sp. ATCC 53533]
MRSQKLPSQTVVTGVGGALAALAVTVVVSMPVVVGLSGTVGDARSGSGMVGAWTSRAGSVLAGKVDALLLLVRCPSIKNGSGLVPLLLQPSVRNGIALRGEPTR